MLCESCKENEATIHLTQVVDGVVKKLHLCESCASDNGFDVHGPMSITDILLGMGGQQPGEETSNEEDVGVTVVEKTCPRCHMRRTDFKKTSRLGCPVCYETFADELPHLLKAMHRSEQHVGKIPAHETERVRVSAELASLKKSLKEAVGSENYEEAARIRDRIKSAKSRVVPPEEEAAS